MVSPRGPSLCKLTSLALALTKWFTMWLNKIHKSWWKIFILISNYSYLPDVFPLPLQNHFFVELHMTTQAGSCIPQYLKFMTFVSKEIRHKFKTLTLTRRHALVDLLCKTDHLHPLQMLALPHLEWQSWHCYPNHSTMSLSSKFS